MWMADQLAVARLINTRAQPLATTATPAALLTLQRISPRWSDKRVVEIDVRDVLKWSAGLWDVIKRTEDYEYPQPSRS